jgi:hypothetical protein
MDSFQLFRFFLSKFIQLRGYVWKMNGFTISKFNWCVYNKVRSFDLVDFTMFTVCWTSTGIMSDQIRAVTYDPGTPIMVSEKLFKWIFVKYRSFKQSVTLKRCVCLKYDPIFHTNSCLTRCVFPRRITWVERIKYNS